MKKFIGILAALMVSQTARAGLLLEPELGYEMGTLKCTFVNGTDCSGKFKAVAYGLRLGYKFPLGFWVTGEYDGDSGDTFTPDNSATKSSDQKHTSIGVTAGFDTIIGLRFFAGYNFVEKLTVSQAGVADSNYSGGSSTKLGIGYMLPLLPVAINLEYWMGTYKKFEQNGVTNDVSALFSTLNPTAILLTVSAPLSL